MNLPNLVLAPLFIWGSISWWIVTVVSFVVVSFALAERKAKLATTAVLGWVLCVTVFGDMTILNTIVNDPIGSGLKVLEYIGVGAGWCLFSWYLACRRRNDNYVELKYKWLKEQGVKVNRSKDGPEIPVNLRRKWEEYLCSLQQYDPENQTGWWEVSWVNNPNGDVPPKVMQRHSVVKFYWWDYTKRHVRELIFWLPLSLYWALNGSIRSAAKRIVRSISWIGESIANKVFKNVDKDFEIPAEPVVEGEGER